MTTDDDAPPEQYIPDEEEVLNLYVNHCDPAALRDDDFHAEFDRFLDRVRRDAAREALKHFRKAELAIIPLDADEDAPIRVRQQALAWRIEMHLLANHPETEDQT